MYYMGMLRLYALHYFSFLFVLGSGAALQDLQAQAQQKFLEKTLELIAKAPFNGKQTHIL